MGRRERYLAEGASGLGDAELLALILETGSGGRSALTIATELIEREGGLVGMVRRQPHAWVAVAGIGLARAVRVHAALELGKRALVPGVPSEAIRDAAGAFAILGPPLASLVEEELHALYLDRRNRPLARRRLTLGSDSHTIVEPRQVYRLAVQLGAAGVILAHNHPSGDPTPSMADRTVTDRVARAGDLLGIPLLDHLVVAGVDWRSVGPTWQRAAEPPWTG